MIAIQDHLVLAYLRKGQNNDALNVYAKMLRTQIQTYGWNHTESQKTLTKINLLSGGKKCTYSNDHLYSAAEKVKSCCFLADAKKSLNTSGGQSEFDEF